MRLLPAFALIAASTAHGHGDVRPTEGQKISFPDTEGRHTVVVDLHTHSVFSDGHVWPTIRVREAERDGIDGIAITEHLEWQPHIEDIPHQDRNRAYEEAARSGSGLDLMVIPGAEITRSDAAGHMNAVFVKDANALVAQRDAHTYQAEHRFPTREEAERFAADAGQLGAHAATEAGSDFWAPFADRSTYVVLANYGTASTRPAREVLEEAKRQDAFVFWNHPSFETPNAELNDFHRDAIEADLLSGVEVANGGRYYPNAHRLALKHNLALIGTSDVHELIAWDYEGRFRPVTLVLAEDRTPAAVKRALYERRTVIWQDELLIARTAEMTALLEASLVVSKSGWYGSGSVAWAELENRSSAVLVVRNEGGGVTGRSTIGQPGPVRIEPHSSKRLSLGLDARASSVELRLTVLNALVAPQEPAKLTLILQP